MLCLDDLVLVGCDFIRKHDAHIGQRSFVRRADIIIYIGIPLHSVKIGIPHWFRSS